MTQPALAFYDEVPAPAVRRIEPPVVVRNEKRPRDYQETATAAILSSLATNRSTLAVLATGLGKTFILGSIARDWPGRVLVLAHRDELVIQARARIEEMTGEPTGIEQGEWFSRGERIVVGSVQTVQRKRRLEDMDADFGLVIVDEAHHFTAPTFRRPIEHFANAKVLGVTATPDRGDEQALGQIFDDVSFTMDIRDGIDGGWLVPIDCRRVEMEEINLDGVRKVAGDLGQGQLDEAMIKAVEGIVAKTIEYGGDRQCIAFFPGVRSAEFAAEKFNVARPGSAICISAETEPELRRRLIHDFREGRYQYLANCQIACLDSETEILTRQGWVGHKEITHEHQIANWKDGSISFAKPLAIEVRPRRTNERMVSIQTPRLSMRVTDEHRVVCRAPGAAKWKVVRAHEAANKVLQIPVSGIAPPEIMFATQETRSTTKLGRRIAAISYGYRKRGMKPEEARSVATEEIAARDALRYADPGELTQAECNFIGYWLGDGSLTRRKADGVSCVLHNERTLGRSNHWIDHVLHFCGFDVRTRTVGSVRQWAIGRGTGFGPQRRRGFYRVEPYLVKAGSDLLWGLNEHQFDALLFGFWMADGNHGDHLTPRSGSYEICNTNVELLNRLQAIAVCRGFRCSLRWRANSGFGKPGKPLGHLYASKRDAHAMTKHRMQIEAGNSDETVWCVKSHTGLIVARRRGSVFVTGNTEGFDAPGVSLIVQGRPTLSRALYSQMIGRGTRALPGIVDGPETAEARRAAIAASAKPDLLVLDFVGNTDKHSLISMVDVLGGDYTPAEVAEAKKKEKQAGGAVNALAMLELARKELAALAARQTANVKARMWQVDPFKVMGVSRDSALYLDARYGFRPMSPKQHDALLRLGFSEGELEGIGKRGASALFEKNGKRIENGYASIKRLRRIRKHMPCPDTLSHERAGQAMDYLASIGWRNPDMARLAALVEGVRQPGEEG